MFIYEDSCWGLDRVNCMNKFLYRTNKSKIINCSLRRPLRSILWTAQDSLGNRRRERRRERFHVR
jgi:hypothetical protein